MELTSYFAFISNSNYIKIISLLIISSLFATLYACLCLYAKNNYNFVPKVISIISLILIVYFVDTPAGDNLYSNFRMILITALCFHVVGDTIIELSDNFLYYLPFFMVGHVLYGYIFYQDIFYAYNMEPANIFIDISIRHYIAIFMAFSFGLFMCYMLLPKLPVFLFIGVIIYTLVLLFEGLFAIFHPACMTGIPWILLGITMYATSDCLIAYNEFVSPIYARVYLTWPLYYFAQIIIVFSLLEFHYK